MNDKPSDFGGLFSVQRVVIVGANGAGKTWLAARVSERLGVPVTHNDALALITHWTYRNRADVQMARDKVAAQEAWIIEGGPSVISGKTRTQAQLIIWLDMPRHVRVARIVWRSLRFMGRQRPEHPVGNRDWPGPRQTRFILKAWTSDADLRTTIAAQLKEFEGHVVCLQGTKDVTAWLDRQVPS